MGSVTRKTFTKPLPANADVIARQGVKLARWKDTRGKVRTAPLTAGQDGTSRIRVEAATFTARYRDGEGIVVEVATGCRTEDAARQVLAELERKAERVRSGLISPGESRIAQQIGRPIVEQFAAYLDSLTAAGSVEHHRRNVQIYLRRLSVDSKFTRLADLSRGRPGAPART